MQTIDRFDRRFIVQGGSGQIITQSTQLPVSTHKPIALYDAGKYGQHAYGFKAAIYDTEKYDGASTYDGG